MPPRAATPVVPGTLSPPDSWRGISGTRPPPPLAAPPCAAPGSSRARLPCWKDRPLQRAGKCPQQGSSLRKTERRIPCRVGPEPAVDPGEALRRTTRQLRPRLRLPGADIPGKREGPARRAMRARPAASVRRLPGPFPGPEGAKRDPHEGPAWQHLVSTPFGKRRELPLPSPALEAWLQDRGAQSDFREPPPGPPGRPAALLRGDGFAAVILRGRPTLVTAADWPQ